MLRPSLRLPLLLYLILGYFLPSTARTDTQRRIRVARYCRWFCRMIGIEIDKGEPGRAEAGLVVCNHLSWLDPVIFMAQRPEQVFVTSVEVRDSFFLGDVCKKAGCMFVERRSTRAVREDQRLISDALQRHPVMVFPEATSTNGDAILPFKPAFFESARQAAVPVHPWYIRYRSVSGKPVTKANRDLIYWYGDMPFLPHLAKLLTQRHIDVAIRPLPSLDWQHHPDRKAMALAAHHQVSQACISG